MTAPQVDPAPGDESSDPTQSEAERLFADYMKAHELGEELDFEAFCRLSPGLEAQLRELHAGWSWAEELWRLPPPQEPDGSGPGSGPGSSPGNGPRYEMHGEIGQGGMGVVYGAWDRDLRRKLAMKVSRVGAPDADAPSSVKRSHSRFLEEAQVTAQLDHPGVVPIHELGIDGEGRAYFTMRMVEGRTLAEVLELVTNHAEGWSRTRALGVLAQVCETLAFAHSRGVLHRDLKPANIMVGRFGEVYVMDWGLAKVTQGDSGPERAGSPPNTESTVTSLRTEAKEDSSDSSLDTMQGTVLGTPGYMAPEQAIGIEELGPAVDVYSVGAILYHLLSGRTPFFETPRSNLLEAIRTSRPQPLHTLTDDLPGELEAICSRSMAPRPRDRYASMEALAADLRAFLENRVVQAHATGVSALARKWVARNRGLSAALAIAGVLIASAGMLAFRAQGDAIRTEQEKVRELTEANAVIRRENYAANLVAANRSLATGDPASARSHLDQAPTELRGWEWRYLHSRLDQARLTLDCKAQRVAMSPAAKWIATCHPNGSGFAFDARTGRQLAEFESTDGSVEFSPDGRLLLVGLEGRIHVLSTDAWEIERTVETGPGVVTALDFSPDGSRYAIACWSRVQVRSRETHRLLAEIGGASERIWALEWSPDGTRIATSSMDNTVRVFDPDRGETLRIQAMEDTDRWIHHWGVTWSNDGERVIAGFARGQIEAWDANTGQSKLRTTDSRKWISDVVQLPRNRVLVAGFDSSLRIIDLAGPSVTQRLFGHTWPPIDVAVSEDRSTAVSAGSANDPVVRVWDLGLPPDLTLTGHGHDVGFPKFGGDDGRLLTSSRDGTIRLWDVEAGESLFAVKSVDGVGPSAVFNADDSLIYASLGPGDGGASTVWALDPRTAEVSHQLSTEGQRAAWLAADPTGRWLATRSVTAEPELVIWDIAHRTVAARANHLSPHYWQLQFDPSGNHLAVCEGDQTRIVRLPGLEVVGELRTAEEPLAFAYVPGGELLAVGQANGVIRLYETLGWTEVGAMRENRRAVNSLDFTPDGSRLMSGSYELVRLWDVDGRRLVHTFTQDWSVHTAALAPSGARIAAVGNGRLVQVVDLEPGPELRALRASVASARREAAPIVDALFDQFELKDEVIAALEAQAGLTPMVLRSAVRQARSRTE